MGGLKIKETSSGWVLDCPKVLSQLYASEIDTEHNERFRLELDVNVLEWMLNMCVHRA